VTDPVEWAFRHHKTEIYRYLRRRTGTPERAEELTQEVFADAAQAFSRLTLDRSHVLALLYAIAKRRVVDESRRWARRGESVPLELVAEPAASPVPRSDTARVIKEAVLSLRPEQREVLVMKLLEGRSFAEIASRLGTTEGACKMRLRRALEHVRHELVEVGIEP
jgi:RNA polymerase sigma-70 factor (ECF subfamily)